MPFEELEHSFNEYISYIWEHNDDDPDKVVEIRAETISWLTNYLIN